jgi:DNA-binding MarR family transcriptional regulator
MKKKSLANQSDVMPADLEGLLVEILRAFQDLRAAGAHIGLVADQGGEWGLIQTLTVEGPMTMSALARRRSVSRQYIQKIASFPIRKGWIALEPNPADRRAPLMVVTDRGQRRLRIRRQRIDRALRSMSSHCIAEDIAKATATVAQVRALLEKVPG